MNNPFTEKTSTVLAVHCLRSSVGSRGGGDLGDRPP